MSSPGAVRRAQALWVLRRACEALPADGGECGVMAIALNDVLFAGRGQLVAVLNEYLRTRGRWLGHIVVRHEDSYWDLTGAVAHAELERWGTLPAYTRAPRLRALGEALGILRPVDVVVHGHREDAFPLPDRRGASEARLWTVTETQVRQHMPGTVPVEHATAVLRGLRAQVCSRPSRKGGSRQ